MRITSSYTQERESSHSYIFPLLPFIVSLKESKALNTQTSTSILSTKRNLPTIRCKVSQINSCIQDNPANNCASGIKRYYTIFWYQISNTVNPPHTYVHVALSGATSIPGILFSSNQWVHKSKIRYTLDRVNEKNGYLSSLLVGGRNPHVIFNKFRIRGEWSKKVVVVLVRSQITWFESKLTDFTCFLLQTSSPHPLLLFWQMYYNVQDF